MNTAERQALQEEARSELVRVKGIIDHGLVPNAERYLEAFSELKASFEEGGKFWADDPEIDAETKALYEGFYDDFMGDVQEPGIGLMMVPNKTGTTDNWLEWTQGIIDFAYQLDQQSGGQLGLPPQANEAAVEATTKAKGNTK